MNKILRLMTLLLVGLVGAIAVPEKVHAASMDDVRNEAKRGGYQLVTSEILWEMISRDQAGVLLVDTRQNWEYAAGHIKDAVNFPMEPTWLARLTKRGELEQFLGPDKQKHIVFY